MKQIFITLTLMFTILTSANAMSYEQARDQALFLTDKMAYELNLTEEQYEAAYEINLDYLLSVNNSCDCYADCWTHRNLDLSYILLDWQYRMFCDASYFYRPIWWDGGYWHFGIYARYPHRDYFYFDRPAVFISYRGGHSWGMNGGVSWYHGHFGSMNHGNIRGIGMRDSWNRNGGNRGAVSNRGTMNSRGTMSSGRGTYGNGNGSTGRGTYGNSNGSTGRGTYSSSRGTMGGNRGSFSTSGRGTYNGGSSSMNQMRQSSTRQTVRHESSSHSSFGGGSSSMGSSRGGSSSMGSSHSSFGGGSSSMGSSHSSFGGGSTSMGGGSHSGGGGGSMGGGSMGGRR